METTMDRNKGEAAMEIRAESWDITRRAYYRKRPGGLLYVVTVRRASVNAGAEPAPYMWEVIAWVTSENSPHPVQVPVGSGYDADCYDAQAAALECLGSIVGED